MDVHELLEEIRGLYVRELAKASLEGDYHVEPAFRFQTGKLALDGALQLPMRADLIERIGERRGESRTVVPTERLEFEPFGFVLEGCEVAVSPFDWSQVSVTVTAADTERLQEVLHEWFMQHFDPDDANRAADDGLFGVVHFLSDPVLCGGVAHLELDLGSAPVEALEALLFGLADAGCTHVVLGALSAT